MALALLSPTPFNVISSSSPAVLMLTFPSEYEVSDCVDVTDVSAEAVPSRTVSDASVICTSVPSCSDSFPPSASSSACISTFFSPQTNVSGSLFPSGIPQKDRPQPDRLPHSTQINAIIFHFFIELSFSFSEEKSCPYPFLIVSDLRRKHKHKLYSHSKRTTPAIATRSPISFRMEKSAFSTPNIPQSSMSQEIVSWAITISIVAFAGPSADIP